MKKIFLLFAMSILFAACSGSSSDPATSTTEQNVMAKPQADCNGSACL